MQIPWLADPANGPLIPLARAERDQDHVLLTSGIVTRTGWWEAFLPNARCPRFRGGIDIPDAYQAFCLTGDCPSGCGAEDGFVELKANRFRLMSDQAVIERLFPALHRFLARAGRLAEELDQIHGTLWQLNTSTDRPVFEARCPETAIPAHLEVIQLLYPEATGVRGKMDLTQPPVVTLDQLDLEQEDDLMTYSRLLAFQEAVRDEAVRELGKLALSRGGTANAEKVSFSGLTYFFREQVEAEREGLYMGRLAYREGIPRLQEFVRTTLGGGRWN